MPSTSTGVAKALQQAREKKLPGDSPMLDAQVLLAEVMQQPRAWLLAHPEAKLRGEQEADWADKLNRLKEGEPLPYIIGHWEFFGLEFKVTPDVLIPRPESELLVESALGWLHSNPGKRRVVDVGTGSGCIAISLAVNVPDADVTAVDISGPALEVARFNAHKHGVDEQLDFKESDLLKEVEGPFDVICANLPYIPRGCLPALEVYKHEPRLALDGGTDGLDLIERLLQAAGSVLRPGGVGLLEIEDGQEESALRLAVRVLPEAQVAVLVDLAGKPRLLRMER